MVKALALGADFVFVGRPFLFAAALGGEPVVKHAVTLLSQEIDRDLALLRVAAVEQLKPEFVRFVP